MSRLNKDRQTELEPRRMENAIAKISALGYDVTVGDNKDLCFTYKGSIVVFFPYSGWHSGKTITDGRGLQNLLKQIKTQL